MPKNVSFRGFCFQQWPDMPCHACLPAEENINKVWKVTARRTKRPTSAKLRNLLFLSVLICKACQVMISA